MFGCACGVFVWGGVRALDFVTLDYVWWCGLGVVFLCCFARLQGFCDFRDVLRLWVDGILFCFWGLLNVISL